MKLLVHFKNSVARPIRMLKLTNSKLEFLTPQNLVSTDKWALGFEDGKLYKIDKPISDTRFSMEDEDGYIDVPFFEWQTDEGFEQHNLEQWHVVSQLITGRFLDLDIYNILSKHFTDGMFEYFDKINVKAKNTLISEIYTSLVYGNYYWSTIESFFKNMLSELPRITIQRHEELITLLDWVNSEARVNSTKVVSVELAPTHWAVCKNCNTVDGCSNIELNYLGIVSKSYVDTEEQEDDDGYVSNSCSHCGAPNFTKIALMTPAIISTTVPAYLKLFKPITTCKEMAKVMRQMHNAETNPATHINTGYVDLMDRQVELHDDEEPVPMPVDYDCDYNEYDPEDMRNDEF